jgi:secernin
MCDTLVALAQATAAGATLFAKNSDRERNEAQRLDLQPARDHAEGSELRLTYVAIPQVARTRACLIARPFWMWGAEMGANDAGVAIGNEAVNSVVAPGETPALTGMDLVRLGLERSASAAEAVEVMTGLLERHGQGGDCGHLESFFYHNSFIVADPREALVLETVGRWWTVQRVERARAISNVLSIGKDDRTVSADLQAHAEAEGWCGRDGRFDVAGRLWDPERDVVTRGRERCGRATGLLAERGDQITVADMIRVLRDHGSEAAADPDWTPASIVGRSICMHAGGGDRRSQSVGSMVSELRADVAVHWLTGSSAPCLSVFKPVVMVAGPPDQGPAPIDHYDGANRWWRHERFHRAALSDYATGIAAFASIRDDLERRFRERIDCAIAAQRGTAHLRAEVDACWREADAAEEAWTRDVEPVLGDGEYEESWARLSRLAGLPQIP